MKQILKQFRGSTLLPERLVLSETLSNSIFGLFQRIQVWSCMMGKPGRKQMRNMT